MARNLAGEISPLEMDELENLLKENHEAHLKIQSITELWNQDDHFFGSATEDEYQEHLKRLKANSIFLTQEENEMPGEETNVHRKRRMIRLSLFITAFLITGAFAFYFIQRNSKPAESLVQKNTANTITTRNGSRTTINLPDGSVVLLNSGSKLTYDKQFGTTLREVYLSGEGFFDVVHNEEKPFIIHTAFFDIKDLGTKFNVKCYPEDKTTETSLVEGSVEIVVKKRPETTWLLKPDEKLVLLNETVALSDFPKDIKKASASRELNIAVKNLTYLPQDSFALETAWTHNKLSFEDEVFGEVAKKMTRWYAAEFEFRNKKQAEIHMSGSFVSESLEQAMDALKYTNRFNYTIKEGKVIIY